MKREIGKNTTMDTKTCFIIGSNDDSTEQIQSMYSIDMVISHKIDENSKIVMDIEIGNRGTASQMTTLASEAGDHANAFKINELYYCNQVSENMLVKFGPKIVQRSAYPLTTIPSQGVVHPGRATFSNRRHSDDANTRNGEVQGLGGSLEASYENIDFQIMISSEQAEIFSEDSVDHITVSAHTCIDRDAAGDSTFAGKLDITAVYGLVTEGNESGDAANGQQDNAGLFIKYSSDQFTVSGSFESSSEKNDTFEHITLGVTLNDLAPAPISIAYANVDEKPQVQLSFEWKVPGLGGLTLTPCVYSDESSAGEPVGFHLNICYDAEL